MIYNKELIDIVKNKNFKTFWHCLDYLTMAGYSNMDAFGISLQEFGESRIYSDVAFIKIPRRTQLFNTGVYGGGDLGYKQIIKVGILGDTNIHLAGIYNMYRTWISNSNNHIDYPDIEETCEIIRIKELTPFLMTYLIKVSELHYGFEAFKYTPTEYSHIDGIPARDQITAFASLQPEIDNIMTGRQRLESLQRGLNDIR